jgi:hypothetical protein
MTANKPVDTFAADRIRWLDQVIADVSPQAFAAAYVIATRFLNRKTGEAWPSIPTVAKALNKSARRTQDAIGELVTKGHLQRSHGGKGHSNRYRIILHDRTESSDQSSVSEDEIVLPSDTNTGRNRPPSDPMTGHFRPDDRTESSKKYGRNRPPNPLKEPFDEPFEKDPPIVPHTKAPKPKRDNPDLKAIVDGWNELAANVGLPAIQHLTGTRKTLMRARWHWVGGMDGWNALIEKIRASDFLTGRSGKFQATFDWVLKPANLTKVMEGNYDNRTAPAPPSRKSTVDTILETLTGRTVDR